MCQDVAFEATYNAARRREVNVDGIQRAFSDENLASNLMTGNLGATARL